MSENTEAPRPEPMGEGAGHRETSAATVPADAAPPRLTISKSGTAHWSTCRSVRTAPPISDAAIPYLAEWPAACRSCKPTVNYTSFMWDVRDHADRVRAEAEARREREYQEAETARAAAEAARRAERERERERAIARAGTVRAREIERIRTAAVDDLAVLAVFEGVLDLVSEVFEGDEPIAWEPGEAELLIRGGCTLTDFRAGVDAMLKSGRHRAGPAWGYIRNTALRRRVAMTAELRDEGA